MYLGTGWDGQFSHLYRVGDMIPQFTCKGFHGCEWGFPRLCVYVWGGGGGGGGMFWEPIRRATHVHDVFI